MDFAKSDLTYRSFKIMALIKQSQDKHRPYRV